MNDITKMMDTDQGDDAKYVYTREKVDQRMKQICGDKFVPWEVRYGEQEAR